MDAGIGVPQARALLRNVWWPPNTGPPLTHLWGSLTLCEAGRTSDGSQVGPGQLLSACDPRALHKAGVMVTRLPPLTSHPVS